MKDFMPNYANLVQAARNICPERMPLYEHHISDRVMEKILNKQFSGLKDGNKSDKREYFRNFNEFFKQMGYDTVSFELGIAEIMPHSGALRENKPGVIKNRKDFEKYPWAEIPDIFFSRYSDLFDAMRVELPPGMLAVGGPGYGLFECVQDVVGYQELCYISFDDPDLYSDLFKTAGNMMAEIWKRFMKQYSDAYAVCRFGDDLGFRNSTLLPPGDIRYHIIPQYKRIIEIVHSYGKPFVFHCCGKIFDIMEDLINVAKIDAKHSNEDQIAKFSVWVEKYGNRIGNFGGVDTDHLCRKSEAEIRSIVREVVSESMGHGGFALGSGNSIPDYVPPEGYLAMIEEARVLRGE